MRQIPETAEILTRSNVSKLEGKDFARFEVNFQFTFLSFVRAARIKKEMDELPAYLRDTRRCHEIFRDSANEQATRKKTRV